MSHPPQLPEADLARLADGSLADARGRELRAQADRSPDLARALDEQERAITILQSLDGRAPNSLRTAIQEQIRTAGVVRRRPRLRLRIAFGVAAAAACVAVVAIALPGGGGAAGPSLPQTVRLALASATYPAPVEAPGRTSTLNDTAAGIPFPYWQRSVGWRALGARVDRLSGRRVVTVFYGAQGYRVGYAIVDGAPVPVRGGLSVTRGGVVFRLLREGSAGLVTWLRSGHTCVIAGRGVGDRALLRLATADLPSWD